MRKKIVIKGMFSIIMMAVLVVMGSAFSVAGEREPGVSVGFNAGAAWCLDGYLGTGLTGRVFVEYAPYIHEIGLKLTGGYWRFEDTVSAGYEPLIGRVDVLFSSWYLTGGGIYRLSRKNITPFLTANAGLYKYEDEQVNATAGVAPVPDVKDGWALGVNGGGGVEFFTNKTYSISLEGLMHFAFGDESYQVADVSVMFRFF